MFSISKLFVISNSWILWTVWILEYCLQWAPLTTSLRQFNGKNWNRLCTLPVSHPVVHTYLIYDIIHDHRTENAFKLKSIHISINSNSNFLLCNFINDLT